MPVTPSLQGHWPVVWLHVLPAAPTGWQSQAGVGWGPVETAGVEGERQKKKKRQIEYQYLRSGTVVTPYFVCHNPKSGGPDDVATLSHRWQNVQPVWSRCQRQQAVPGSPGFCWVFKGFDGSLSISQTQNLLTFFSLSYFS